MSCLDMSNIVIWINNKIEQTNMNYTILQFPFDF